MNKTTTANAHQELVDALELCKDWFEQHRPLEANKKCDKAREAMQAARVALAHASSNNVIR